MLFGVHSVVSQWQSSRDARNAGADLARRVAEYQNIPVEELTEEQRNDILAHQQMQANLNKAAQHQYDAVNQYNQATQGATDNIRRISAKAPMLSGFGGSVYNNAGAMFSTLSEFDPLAGFFGNAMIGGQAYRQGLAFGFNGENKGLNIQRAMDQAVQEKFMKGTVKSGNEALGDLNKQSGVLAGNLTDTAMNNTDKYYAAQSRIDESGIEGSLNMSRNLDYLKSRDDTANQLQYDMIRGSADNVGRGMANNFNQLLQEQEQNTLQTLVAPVQFDMLGTMKASQQFKMNQATAQDWDFAIKSALPQKPFKAPNTPKVTVKKEEIP
jgi:hypothetical protein